MSWPRAWKQLLASRPWTPAALTQSSSICLENKGFSICCLPMVNLQCPEVVGLDNLSSSMLVLWKGITGRSCCHDRKSLPPPSLKTLPWRPREPGGNSHPTDIFFHWPTPAPNGPKEADVYALQNRLPETLLSFHTSQLCPKIGKTDFATWIYFYHIRVIEY